MHAEDPEAAVRQTAQRLVVIGRVGCCESGPPELFGKRPCVIRQLVGLFRQPEIRLQPLAVDLDLRQMSFVDDSAVRIRSRRNPDQSRRQDDGKTDDPHTPHRQFSYFAVAGTIAGQAKRTLNVPS